MRCAEIDSNGLVLRVIQAASVEWCADRLGGVWIEDTNGEASPGMYYLDGHFLYEWEQRDTPEDGWWTGTKVYYNGAAYICLTDENIDLPTNTETWAPLGPAEE